MGPVHNGPPKWATCNGYYRDLMSLYICPISVTTLSSVTALEAFRHNPTDVASYHCSIEQVLYQRSVPAVPLVLR